jgi:sporulation protein YlmC with PRC-barrel domain
MTSPATSKILHAQLHLFDRQVVRADDGRLVCKVDDLETALDEHGRPYVTAILTGPLALGPRIGGVIGRLIVATTELFRAEEDPAPQRIAMALVSDIGSAIQVGGDPQEPALERWARQNIIAPIPGSGEPGTVTEPRLPHTEKATGRTRLSRLIGLRVRDGSGEPVGQVADVRLSQDGPLLEEVQHAFRLSGLIVVPRHTGQLFGYERGPGGQAPLLVRSIIRRLHHGSCYVPWSQIELPMSSSDGIRLSVPRTELAPLTDLYQRDPAA